MSSIKLQYIRGETTQAEYLCHTLSELHLADLCRGDSELEKVITTELERGFSALDKLDRNDPFWHHSNKLPTLPKLPDYAEYRLKTEPNNSDAARLLICYAFATGSGHLDLNAWTVLKNNHALDLTFLVDTAWLSSPYWTNQYIPPFVDLVNALELQEQVLPELDRIAAQHPDALEWVAPTKTELQKD
ncbi:MAG: hypothetical protein OEZ39_17730 [Gammaproteobacteria bacterium]|nr:hypothetical protein [Gammaproteobacteria bacterium]MDH5653706.1 hypothetical protein [Gammaproteobacteria bacterium]